MKPLFIGISGPSACGKSATVKELLKLNSSFVRFKVDNYWKDAHTFPTKHGYRNWERPENLNFDLVYKHLLLLKQGKPLIDAPIYKKGKRYTKIFEPKNIIFVEGFLLFADERINKLLDLKIYIDVPGEISIQRKIAGNRKESSSEEYCRKVYWPEYKQYVKPFKEKAELILDGTSKIQTNVNIILNKIKELNS